MGRGLGASVPIATFGPTTGWVGRTITYENGQFTLEGHGAISAADVLTYDRQGQLIWAYDGLKEWVQKLASTNTVVAPQAPTSEAAPHRAEATATPRRGVAKRRPIVLVVLVVVLIALAVGGALVYRSYDRYRTKKQAQDAWLVYWNAAMGVRNRYVRDFNKVAAQSQKQLTAKKHDTIADALQRAAKAMAAIEPTRELADAHAALVSEWRKDASGIRRHANAAGKVGQKKVDLLDFVAVKAKMDRITKELNASAACADRADAAWEKWKQAAKREAKRLGYTFIGI